VPVHDSPWVSTAERWRREALPKDISPAEYFDCGRLFLALMSPLASRCERSARMRRAARDPSHRWPRSGVHPPFHSGGLTCLRALEVKAGMGLVKLKRRIR
jgi:hypothetical protein